MIKEMNTFNNKLFSMSIEDLNNTKDLIADIIKNKVKSVMKVGMKVNVVQKTKKTPGVITKIMQSKCLVDLSVTVIITQPPTLTLVLCKFYHLSQPNILIA